MNMKDFKHGKKGFMKEVISELNLSKEQAEKFEEMKKGMKSGKKILMIKLLLGRMSHKDMINTMIDKVEEGENILTEEQRKKLREIMMEKNKKLFFKILMHKHNEIKDMLEELELTEEQKDDIEKLFMDTEDTDMLDVEEKVDAILSEEQKEKAKVYIKSMIGIDKIAEELEITKEQKNKLMELHERLKAEKRETIARFKKGEMSFAEFFRKKGEIFCELEDIFSKKQLKKIKKMHRHGHYRHCFGH